MCCYSQYLEVISSISSMRKFYTMLTNGWLTWMRKNFLVDENVKCYFEWFSSPGSYPAFWAKWTNVHNTYTVILWDEQKESLWNFVCFLLYINVLSKRKKPLKVCLSSWPNYVSSTLQIFLVKLILIWKASVLEFSASRVHLDRTLLVYVELKFWWWWFSL